MAQDAARLGLVPQLNPRERVRGDNRLCGQSRLGEAARVWEGKEGVCIALHSRHGDVIRL